MARKREPKTVVIPARANRFQPVIVIWKDSAWSEDEHPGPAYIASIGFVTHIDDDGITIAQDVESESDPRHRKTILRANILRITKLRVLAVPEFA